MARSRRPVKNPSIPRLEWVAKTYPDWVWYYTVRSFFEATGMDHQADEFMDEAYAIRARNEMAHHDGRDPALLPDELMGSVASMISASGNENTIYDKHLPWLAKNVNADGKRFVKALRKEIKERYPDFILRRPPFRASEFAASAGVTQADLDSAAAAGQLITVDPIEVYRDESPLAGIISDLGGDPTQGQLGELRGAEIEYAEAFRTIASLRDDFGSIVRWADETGADLSGYDAFEAGEAAHEWEAVRPKDLDIVPGDIVYKFSDGWTFQELSTKPQLKCEGVYLGHCVKSYKTNKIGVVYRIFSLRNADGEPVATLEWMLDGEYVRQFRTLGNRLPSDDDFDRALEFRLNYIDKNMVSGVPAVIPVDANRWPPLAADWGGEFKGMYEFDGDPATAFAVYEIESDGEEHRRDGSYRILVTMKSLGDPTIWLEDDEDPIPMGELMLRPNGVGSMSPQYIEQDHSELTRYGDAGVWSLWATTGVVPFYFRDELLIKYVYGAPASLWERVAQGSRANPGRRKVRPQAKRKTPEWKRLLDRSHRLWETYDAKPLKKNLVAFGAHIEKMKSSASLKVKTEARRAERAFNAEFKARGWKR